MGYKNGDITSSLLLLNLSPGHRRGFFCGAPDKQKPREGRPGLRLRFNRPLFGFTTSEEQRSSQSKKPDRMANTTVGLLSAWG